MNLDTTDLRLISLIAQEGSLTKAAARVHLSLSAVSTRMKLLEDRFGFRILYREPSGVRMTQAGGALVSRARRVLDEMRTLEAELAHFSSELRGHIRVFANTTAATEVLPGIARLYLGLHPNINVDIHEQMNDEIVHAVIDGVADVGVVAGSVPPRGLEVSHFATDRLVLVTPLLHPLAQQAAVRFAATFGHDHVMFRQGSTLQAFLDGIARSSGTELNVRTHVQDFESLVRMVEAGIGVGVIPESAARRHARNLKIRLVALEDDWCIRQRYVIVRQTRQLAQYVRDFVDLIRADDPGSAC